MLPFFGDIDLDSPEQYYDSEIQYRNQTIYIDLNFDEDQTHASKLEYVKSFLTAPDVLITNAAGAVIKDFSENGVTKDYVDHHLVAISPDELSEILRDADKSQSLADQLFSVLRLYRIGFYPEDGHIVMDHNLGIGVTDYIVVVNLNEMGQVVSIDMES